MNYLLGIDLGTSSLRAALIGETGKTVAIAGKEYPILSIRKDWAEQDPEHWWQALKYSIQLIFKQSKIKSCEIKGIGFSGQMHGLVAIDRSGKCLRNAIPWVDKRSQKECEQLKSKIGKERLYRITGIPAFPGFLLPSLLWIKKNEPGIYDRIFKVLSPKDYLRSRLTGEFLSEPTDGCATLLMDVSRRKWSAEVLSKTGIKGSIIPELVESGSIAGRITKTAAEDTGLAAGTLAVAGGGDQAMGAIGIGMVEPGLAASVLGTGGQFITAVKKPVLDPKQRIHTLCHAMPGAWILMGAILSAGLSLRWLRDSFLKENYFQFDEYAKKAPAGSDGLAFFPYLLGERTPYMNPDLKGCFYGITLGHNKGHLVRAVMEGVTFAMKGSLDIFQELGVKIDRVVASGGGAKSVFWKQMQADIYNRNIYSINQQEHSVYGAALLAGVGTGIFRNLKEACSKRIKYSLSSKPHPANVKIYSGIEKTRKELISKILAM